MLSFLYRECSSLFLFYTWCFINKRIKTVQKLKKKKQCVMRTDNIVYKMILYRSYILELS